MGTQAVLLGSAAATGTIWLVATVALRSTWTAGPDEAGYAESSRAGSELPASTARSASV